MLKKILILSFFTLLISACGSEATDVGNPTTDKYLVEGQIDFTTALAMTTKTSFDESENENEYENIPLEDFTVRAIDELNENVDSPVDSEGYFQLELQTQREYSLYVFLGETNVAGFSLVQNAKGERANRLSVESEGSVDMGRLRFTSGEFEPEDEEHEPREHGANEDNEKGDNQGHNQ